MLCCLHQAHGMTSAPTKAAPFDQQGGRVPPLFVYRPRNASRSSLDLLARKRTSMTLTLML